MIELKIHDKSLRGEKADLLAFGLFKAKPWAGELKSLDSGLGGLLAREAKKEGFEAEKGSVFAYAPLSGKAFSRVILVGLGKEAETESDFLHEYGASVVDRARAAKSGRVIIVLPEALAGETTEGLYRAAVGAVLGDYRFDRYKEKKKKHGLLTILFHAPGIKSGGAARALARAKLVGDAVCRARDMINEPANVLTPEALALIARKTVRGAGVRVKVMDERAIARENMRLFLAVAAGSTRHPPRFIHMSYRPKRASGKKIFLIGKGLTFDSGGLSLKSQDHMEDMKIDMSGAAAVICAMSVLPRLRPKCEVHGLVAATENMPDGRSARPGDIVRARSGKTVEILNTDAEGRLTLADVMTYARDKGAGEMIELSTLTGSCAVALGPNMAGLFSNNDGLSKRILDAAAAEGEEMWRMPLSRKLKKQLKSDIADLKNVGSRYGGAITAGLFLQEFAGDTPWAHLDIAGPANTDENAGHIKKGGRGYGVATLLRLLCP